MYGIKHCECGDAREPFTAAESTAELADALLLEWGRVPAPPPDEVCKNCRLPIYGSEG